MDYDQYHKTMDSINNELIKKAKKIKLLILELTYVQKNF